VNQLGKVAGKEVLEIRTPKDSEQTPEAMAQVLASLTNLKRGSRFPFLKKGEKISFEIVSLDQLIRFFIVLPSAHKSYLEGLIASAYPEALIYHTRDYSDQLTSKPHLAIGQLTLSSYNYLPLKNYKDFRDIDPLTSILGIMAKANPGEIMMLQIIIQSAGSSWKRQAQKALEGITQPDTQRTLTHPKKALIERKISQGGFRTGIRLVCSANDFHQASTLLNNLAGAFGAYCLSEGNALILSQPKSWQKKKILASLINRASYLVPKAQILAIDELASIWHLPGQSLAKIRNIAWGRTLAGEPPQDLPVSTNLTKEEKKEINFLAKCEYKNQEAIFGIKKKDRRRHVYAIGKSGTGKSWLLANMAINDIRHGEGLAVIDPHGDLSNILLDYIPSNRINDVCFLDPSDLTHPFHLNPLEVESYEHRELVASGIVSIFYKLYGHSWGPRMEYILRNTLLTLTALPDTTLVQIPELLTDDRYRQKVTDKLEDQVLKNFWLNEYNKANQKQRSEWISPILNKVGQFVNSPMIRNVLNHPKSTVNLEEIMNQGKIVIIDLSAGKLGEDNSALLGAMIITKLQLAAMNRVRVAEEQRKDFFLYVDEFQNFATSSFIKILSEARKYRLNLTLANQYIGQIDQDVQKAIFGNIGTMVSFVVGAEDARILSREYGEVYEEKDLVSLGRYQIVVKLTIDGLVSPAFAAVTLPLPKCTNKNRKKVIKVSQERYTRPLK